MSRVAIYVAVSACAAAVSASASAEAKGGDARGLAGGSAGEPGPASSATPDRAENVAYVEIGGNGGFYSLNYERYLTESVTARIGAMFIGFGNETSETDFGGYFFASPVTISFVGLRSGDHALELGGGLVPGYYWLPGRPDVSHPLFEPTAIAGYRYARPEGGLVFRVGLTPIFVVQDREVWPWAGLSLGYRL